MNNGKNKKINQIINNYNSDSDISNNKKKPIKAKRALDPLSGKRQVLQYSYLITPIRIFPSNEINKVKNSNNNSSIKYNSINNNVGKISNSINNSNNISGGINSNSYNKENYLPSSKKSSLSTIYMNKEKLIEEILAATRPPRNGVLGHSCKFPNCGLQVKGNKGNMKLHLKAHFKYPSLNNKVFFICVACGHSTFKEEEVVIHLQQKHNGNLMLEKCYNIICYKDEEKHQEKQENEDEEDKHEDEHEDYEDEEEGEDKKESNNRNSSGNSNSKKRAYSEHDNRSTKRINSNI